MNSELKINVHYSYTSETERKNVEIVVEKKKIVEKKMKSEMMEDFEQS